MKTLFLLAGWAASAPFSLVLDDERGWTFNSGRVCRLNHRCWCHKSKFLNNEVFQESLVQSLTLTFQRSPERYDRSRKEPLMTIPENWATIEPPNSHLTKKTTSQNETEEESEESDSNESDSESESDAKSGSSSSSCCSTCSNSDDSDDDSSSTISDVNINSKSSRLKRQQQKEMNDKSRFMAIKSKTTANSQLQQSLDHHHSDSISSPVKHAGFVSQAETYKQKQMKLPKVLNNSKSSANNSNSVSMRKFFKRKQQSTVRKPKTKKRAK